jgi:hypothetical protein
MRGEACFTRQRRTVRLAVADCFIRANSLRHWLGAVSAIGPDPTVQAGDTVTDASGPRLRVYFEADPAPLLVAGQSDRNAAVIDTIDDAAVHGLPQQPVMRFWNSQSDTGMS